MEIDDSRYHDQALTTIAEARSVAADRLVTPWWYHPILGLLLAGYVVAVSLGDTLVRCVGLLALLAGIGALVRAYMRITGVWISGFEAGRASRWAYAMGGMAAAGMATSMIIAHTTTLVWPTWSIAGLVLVGIVLLGHRFDVALRAELRAEK